MLSTVTDTLMPNLGNNQVQRQNPAPLSCPTSKRPCVREQLGEHLLTFSVACKLFKISALLETGIDKQCEGLFVSADLHPPFLKTV